MSGAVSGATTRGVVFVHSAPPALCPHVEWAVGGALDARVSLQWTGQPAAPGTLRGELSWVAEQGTGARLASALRGWAHLRYEVTEEPSPGSDGSRWSHTPSLGLHHRIVGVHGDVLVGEDRLRSAVAVAGSDPVLLSAELDRVLGSAWDAELEPFRYAGEGTPVRWLHRVG